MSSSKTPLPVSTSPSSMYQKVNHFWSQNCDPYMYQLPLFDSPLTFASLLLFICGIILISEQFIRRRKAVIAALSGGSGRKTKSSSAAAASPIPPTADLHPIPDARPFVLIHNGFCFGFYGVGLLILIIVTYFGQLLFSCDPKVNQMSEFHQNSLKHTLYTYMIMTFFVLLEPLINVLAGRKIDHAVDLLHQVVWSCLLTAYTAINPIGITQTLVVIDAVHNVIRYGAAVLSINEKDRSGYQKFTDAVRIVIYFLISAHIMHVTNLVDVNKCRPSRLHGKLMSYKGSIFFPVAVYAAIVIAVSIVRLVAHFIHPEVIEKQQQQVMGTAAGKGTRKSSRLNKSITAN